MVNVIGQTELIQNINELYSNNQFPRVSTILGRTGIGKSYITKYIVDILQAKYIKISTIDHIRQAIADAPNCVTDTVIHVECFEGLNFRAKEALLKLCEDVPAHYYIIIEITNISIYEEQFLNRSRLFTMQSYTKNELIEILRTMDSEISDEDITKLFNLVGAPKDFSLCLSYGLDYMSSYMDKILNNICKAQPYNAMKIADALSTKAGDNKIDMKLFFRIIYNKSHRQFLLTTDTAMQKLFMASAIALDTLINCPTVNKRAVFDQFVFALHN